MIEYEWQKIERLEAENKRLREYLFEIQRDTMLDKDFVLGLRQYLGLDKHGRKLDGKE
jgi:hypothetical protein